MINQCRTEATINSHGDHILHHETIPFPASLHIELLSASTPLHSCAMSSNKQALDQDSIFAWRVSACASLCSLPLVWGHHQCWLITPSKLGCVLGMYPGTAAKYILASNANTEVLQWKHRISTGGSFSFILNLSHKTASLVFVFIVAFRPIHTNTLLIKVFFANDIFCESKTCLVTEANRCYLCQKSAPCKNWFSVVLSHISALFLGRNVTQVHRKKSNQIHSP